MKNETVEPTEITERKSELRSATNKLVGWIETGSGGVFELRSPSNKLMGTWDPDTNETRDAQGKKIGDGNLLGVLVTMGD